MACYEREVWKHELAVSPVIFVTGCGKVSGGTVIIRSRVQTSMYGRGRGVLSAMASIRYAKPDLECKRLEVHAIKRG